MKRQSNKLRIIAWTIIGLWLLRPWLFRLFNIDFTNYEIARNFRHVWLLLIPIATGLFVVSSWKDLKLNFKRVSTIFLFTSLTFTFILFMNFSSSMCEWDFSEPLYEHKTSDMKIRLHGLDCGAMDGSPKYDLVTTYNIGPYLTKYTIISRETIDENEWTKK